VIEDAGEKGRVGRGLAQTVRPDAAFREE